VTTLITFLAYWATYDAFRNYSPYQSGVNALGSTFVIYAISETGFTVWRFMSRYKDYNSGFKCPEENPFFRAGYCHAPDQWFFLSFTVLKVVVAVLFIGLILLTEAPPDPKLPAWLRVIRLLFPEAPQEEAHHTAAQG
jgi:hypothetical protein